MSAVKNFALSCRPSNRDKYSVIIPSAGLGNRMARYGPKSLTPIRDGTILSKQIVNDILDDLSDRSGLSDEWDNIDEEIQEEIIATWVNIVERHLKK